MEIPGTNDGSERKKRMSCKAIRYLTDNNALLKWHVLRITYCLYVYMQYKHIRYI